MKEYIVKRLLLMFPALIVLSFVAFLIIQAPPGDYLSTLVMQMEQSGQKVDQSRIESMRQQYGLDQPMMFQYVKWVTGILRGNMGYSFAWNQPVNKLLADRIPLTIGITLTTMLFIYAIAIPIGILSAVRQYSKMDYFFTFVSFIGVAMPNFLLALIISYFFARHFGITIGGLFSSEFAYAPWSFAKFLDGLSHLPVPIIVISVAGTASIIRVMRGCLLDELKKQYVDMARTKGLKENILILKYPVRIALNPIISTIGWMLPAVVSGETITSIVLNLPTTGPLLFNALLNQDMYLAGSIVMFLMLLTFIGTIISDILLVTVDPRIRFDKRG